MRALAPVILPGPVPTFPDGRIGQRETCIGQLLQCEHRASRASAPKAGRRRNPPGTSGTVRGNRPAPV